MFSGFHQNYVLNGIKCLVQLLLNNWKNVVNPNTDQDNLILFSFQIGLVPVKSNSYGFQIKTSLLL